MASKCYKCRSVKRVSGSKKKNGVQDRSKTADNKTEEAKIMSESKAKATLETRLKAEIVAKKQQKKPVAIPLSAREKPIVTLEPEVSEKPEPEPSAANDSKQVPDEASEPEVMPDLDENAMAGETTKEIYHRVHHITMNQLLYQARQSAKAYDKSYLEVQEGQAALDAKLGEIKDAKTPNGADDAAKAQFNDKRKNLRAERDAIQKQLTVATQTAIPLERVCDELEAVASWKLDKPVAFRKQPRLNDVDPQLNANIMELKELVNAKAGIRTTVRAILPQDKETINMKNSESFDAQTAAKASEPQKPVASDPVTGKNPAPEKSAPISGNGNGNDKKPGWLWWIVCAVVVLVIILASRSCSANKKQKAATQEKPAVVAPAKAETPAPAPVPAPAKAEAPVPAPAKVEAPVPVKAETPVVAKPEAPKAVYAGDFGKDVAVTVAADGKTTYNLNNGMTLLASPDGSMKTTFGGLAITEQPVTGYQADAAGNRTLSYADGTKVTVDKDGYASINLNNGLTVAFSKEGTTTSYYGQKITTSTIASYEAGKDGSKKIRYADGNALSVDGKGYAAIDLNNGITIAFSKEGTTTSYYGQKITTSTIASYEAGKDGSKKIRYTDGNALSVDGKGYAAIDLNNGITIAFSKEGTTTSYYGQKVTTSAIASYEAGKDGSKKIRYADGNALSVDGKGYAAIDLNNGITIAFSKEGTTTSYYGQKVTTSAIASYEAGKDGSKKIRYADGNALSVDGKGYAAIDLNNGITISFAKDGVITSYFGQPVTNSAIASYEAGKDGSKKIRYADGNALSVDGKGYATIDLNNGITIAFAKDGMLTSYRGMKVSDMKLTGAEISQNGKRLMYVDGTKVDVSNDGSTTVTLNNGVSIAFTKDGTKTSYGKRVIITKPVAEFSITDTMKSVTYTTGLKCSVDEAGFATVVLPNGITFSFGKDGMTTSFMGQVFTKAALTGFEVTKDGSGNFTYETGMKLTVATNGTTKVSFPNSLAIEVRSLSDMSTSVMGVEVTDSPIAEYMYLDNGNMAMRFQDQNVLIILPSGQMAYALANGLVFANEEDWIGTFYGDTLISESPIAKFVRSADGGKTVTYADGAVLNIAKEGWVAAELPNGMRIAATPSGWETSYRGILVTRAPLSAYQLQGDSRLFGYDADNMAVFLQSKDSIDVVFTSGAEILADTKGIYTLYQGLDVSDAAISSFSLEADNSKHITYADGMKAVVYADGSAEVSLSNGLSYGKDGFTYKGEVITAADAVKYQYADGIRTISFSDDTVVTAGPKDVLIAKKGATVAATEKPVVKEEKPAPQPVVVPEAKPVEPKPVAVPETKPEEAKPVAPVAQTAAKAEPKFLFSLGGSGTINTKGFQNVGFDARLSYILTKGWYVGIQSGYSFAVGSSGVNNIPLLGTFGYLGKNIYGGLLVGATFAPNQTDNVLFSLGGYGGLRYDFTKNVGVFGEAGLLVNFANGKINAKSGVVALGMSIRF